MADSKVNRGVLGMQRRTWGSLVALVVVLLLGTIFYFYPRTLEVRGASLGSTFTADAQLIVRDKIDQTVVQVVPVPKVAVNMKSGYTISYSPEWFELPRRLSVDVCFNRASVLPTTTALPEHVYCQKPVEKVAYMCDDHNVWTQYFSTTQVADLRAYCGETKPSATAPVAATPVVAGEKSDTPAVTNYYTTTGGTNTTVNNEIDMPECDSDEILVWDNDQWNCRDQATVVPTVVTYPSCAPGEVLTSVAGVLGCTSVAAAAYPNCAANETLTSTAGVLSCTPDYTWTANSNIGAAIPVADGGVVKFTSSNGTIVTTSAPGNILNFNVQRDTSTPNNALVFNGALGLYVPAFTGVSSVNAGLGLINVGTASAVDLDVRARSGVSLQGDFVHLGDPTAGPAAAPLLYDTNINYGGRTLQLAGANTVFSASAVGLQPQGLSFNTNIQISGSGSEGIWFTDNSSGAGYGSFVYQENLGAGSLNMGTFNGGPYRFYTNNTERARFSGSGQFGLGINPLAILDVAGAGAGGDAGMQLRGVATVPALSTASAGRVFYNSTTNTFQCSRNGGAYADCMGGTLNAANNGLSLSGATAQLGGNLIQNTNVTNNGFNLIFDGTGNGSGKVATFNGDIDVTGTIDPTRILFSNLAGVNSPSYNPSANSNNYSMRFEEGGNLNFQSDTTNNILHLNNTGQVGIGISSSLTRKLTVQAGPGSSNNGIALLRAGGNPVVELINNTVNGGQIDTYDAAGNPVTRLRNNANSFVVANDNANFGVGTTGPLNRFHVRQGALGDFTAQIENYGGGATSHGLLINAGGNVLSGSQMIEFRRPDGTVIGSVNQNTASTVAFNTTSDRRLKENIVDTNLGLDTLMKLQVHDYNYISDSNGTKMQGFIAQELNDVYSQAVTVGGSNAKTNPWQVDYSKLTPLLTKSIQDLEVKKANKNEIADLNANDENFISELSGILDTTSAQKESIEKLLATLETLRLDVAALQDTVKSIVAALDQDQFGQIKIKKGDTKGTVEFAEKLSRTPVVNVTPHDFVSKGYAIKNVTDRGFEIRLQEEQDDDVTFDWRAVAAREVEYNTSSTGGSTDSTPADDEESDSEEETPIVEEEVTPTEETPVVEEEAPVTDEGGSDTGETPAEEPAIPSGI